MTGTEPEPRWRGPLAPYRVLDLSGELGWLCGRILAEMGADVIKVEPPGGDPGRLAPPLVEGPSGERLGSAWLAYNAGKRGISLDLETVTGQEALRALAGRSHFLIETHSPGHLDRLGLGWDDLSRLNPGLIMTSITPYGQEGPDALAPAGDLELMAASGALWLTGDADRPPVRITHPQAACWASAYAAMGTLIAHHWRQLSGHGQHVDASAQAGVLPALVVAPCFWEVLGQNPMRSGPFLVGRSQAGAAMRNVWPCKDGYLTFAIYGGTAGRQSNRQLVAWMQEQGLAPAFLNEIDWDSFEISTAPAAVVARVESAIAPFLLTLTRDEFFEGARARRLLGYSVATVADIAVDPQLQARQAWEEIPDPSLGSALCHTSGLARFDQHVPRLYRPAPRLGEHNAEILEGLAGATSRPGR